MKPEGLLRISWCISVWYFEYKANFSSVKREGSNVTYRNFKLHVKCKRMGVHFKLMRTLLLRSKVVLGSVNRLAQRECRRLGGCLLAFSSGRCCSVTRKKFGRGTQRSRYLIPFAIGNLHVVLLVFVAVRNEAIPSSKFWESRHTIFESRTNLFTNFLWLFDGLKSRAPSLSTSISIQHDHSERMTYLMV